VRFYEIVDQVIALLRSRGRLSYRALTVEFDLNDDSLAALKEELIDIQELAIDKDGKMLVWKGGEATPPAPSSPPAQPHSPTSYTPPHLAERIRAEQAALEARGSVDGRTQDDHCPVC
jgi:hypothetical protein